MKTIVAVYGTSSFEFLPELKSLEVEVYFKPHMEDITTIDFPVKPHVLLCLPPKNGADKILEMSQVLRMNYPEAKIYLLEQASFPFDKGTLRKNGLDDAFVIPWEKNSVLSAIESASIYLRNPLLLDYTPIFFSDLFENEILLFDVFIFLPKNDVLVPLARQGENMDPIKIQKAFSLSQNVAYIKRKDMPTFQSYFEKTTRKQGKERKSETEKIQEFNGICRELMSNLFVENIHENTYSKSIRLIDELKNTMKKFVDLNYDTNINSTLAVLMNQPVSPYNHATHVALYAALFGACLEYPKPFDLALAGLFHDFGLSVLDENLHNQDPHTIPVGLKAIYDSHAIQATELLKKRKIPLSEICIKAILHHHDPFNGRVPLSEETRILAIADSFDYLTRQNPGHLARSPFEALEHLLEENTINPGSINLDPDMLKKIISGRRNREAA